MKMLTKNWLIVVAAVGAFGSGVLGAAWAQTQTQTGDTPADTRRSETGGDKATGTKAAPKKEAAPKKAAAAKKEKEAVAGRASRIDPDAPVLAAGGVFTGLVIYIYVDAAAGVLIGALGLLALIVSQYGKRWDNLTTAARLAIVPGVVAGALFIVVAAVVARDAPFVV